MYRFSRLRPLKMDYRSSSESSGAVTFFMIVLLFGFVAWLITEPWVSDEEKALKAEQEQVEQAAFYASLPTNDQLFEIYKKCADAGLSVEQKREYKYRQSFITGANCGVPIAQKQAEEATQAADSNATEAAVVGAVGGYLLGEMLR